MNRFLFVAALVLSALLVSCASEEKKPPVAATAPASQPALVQKPWSPLDTDSLRISTLDLGAIANSGVSLPAVSPDGAWVAYLRIDQTKSRPTPQNLFDGKNLSSSALIVRATLPSASEKIIAASGASWPVWFSDSHRLAFVSTDDKGVAQLEVFDLESGNHHTINPGPPHLFMPAVSPDGKWIAVCGYKDQMAGTRIMLSEVNNPRVEDGPAYPGTSDVLPAWIDNDTFIYTAMRDGRSVLFGYNLKDRDNRPLRRINIIANVADSYQAVANLGEPISPGRDKFAYYDDIARCVRVIDLYGEDSLNTSAGTGPAAWFARDQLLASTEKRLTLYSITSPDSKTIVDGLWLPRWASIQDRKILACRPSPDGAQLELVQITVGPTE